MLNQIDLSRADLNLLVLFEAVLEERHVGRASERLNLSASAVSHGLGRLRRLLNDPLFLRTPRGVAPTERAIDLAGPIADILARTRGVLAVAAPFEPAASTRRFTIGAPDGVSAVFLPPLLAALRDRAPGIDISLRQLLPSQGEIGYDRVWRGAFAELDAREMDIAVLPSDAVPARFARRTLHDEDFVVVMRAGHPFAEDPSLARYCALAHLVVSHSGDPLGFVDASLAERGLARRVALTAPNFMFALALVADTDLVSAVPRRFAALYGSRFGIVAREAPIPLPRFRLNAVAPEPAMRDAGLAFIFDLLTRAEDADAARPRQPPQGARGPA